MTLWKLKKYINDKTNSNRYMKFNKNTKVKYKRKQRVRNYNQVKQSRRPGLQNQIKLPTGVRLNSTFRKHYMKSSNQRYKFNKKLPPYKCSCSREINAMFSKDDNLKKHKWKIKVPTMQVEKCRYTACQSIFDFNAPALFDSGSYLIGIDNHSSCSISNNINDFIGPLTPSSIKIRGFQGATAFANGMGTVKWTIEDDNGARHDIFIKNTLFVPAAKQRLLCPQQWAQQSNDHYPSKRGTYSTQDDKCIELHWNQDQFCKTISWNKSTNTALMRSASSFKKFRVFDAIMNFNNKKQHCNHDACVCCESTTFVSDNDELFHDENLPFQTMESINEAASTIQADDFSPQAKDDRSELLRWHYRLGHLSFPKLKTLALLNVIPKKLATVQPPKCSACLYGSMTRQAWRSKGERKSIKVRTVNAPGDCVSVDQLESSTPGFIAQLKGRLTKDRYTCATVFVDHASRHGYIYLQRSLSSNETLHAKRAFEAYAAKYEIRIKHYHCDNGRFADNLFVRHVEENHQSVSYAGVNAHFQNGIAEKRIRDLQESARKMLLHAKARWPEAISIHLWPYALRNANDKICMIPDNINGSSKFERFVSADVSMKIKTHHTLFCPVYALHNSLQAGNKIPKWSSRARLGINLGISPRHSRSVSLVLNLQTGLVSPQYHIVHDDFFETVNPDSGNGITKSYWQRLSGFELDHHIRRSIQTQQSNSPTIQNPTPDIQNLNDEIFENQNQPMQVAEQHPVHQEMNLDHDQSHDDIGLQPLNNDNQNQVQQIDSDVNQSVPTLRRSNRQSKPSWKLRDNAERGLTSYSATYYEALHEEDYSLQNKMADPISFLAKTDADTMYYHQAMKEPDAVQFQKAVVKEILDHCNRKHWEIVKREEVPKHCDVLPAVWSMKRKRDLITRIPYKYKARLNIHGGKQEFGVNFYDTFSPVITWVTLRLLFILALILGWSTRQIDYVLAFPQAPIQFDMYMEIPTGIVLDPSVGSNKTHVLKLLKNLYGQKQASRQFYLFTCEKLEEIGFVKSKIDECMFFKDDMIFVLYVDDGILFMKDESKFESTFSLLASKFDIEDKGDVEQFLGIKFTRAKDEFHVTQTHLIDQIIKDVGLHKSTFKCPQTPSSSTVVLQRNKNEKSFDGKLFNYRSVIGKLNYLEKSSRPDISYATHQCARFSHDPKQSHAQAVIHLVKYLKGTREHGIVMRPKGMALECHVDADFCGNWHKLTAEHDPSTAKSRSGFIITYAGCPISWSSKLQTQVALSTTEAEYVALSTSLRDAIPIMNLLNELKKRKFIPHTSSANIYCKVFEDNSGALEMARVPKMRPRTKHLNVIYHWFTSFVKDGSVKLFPVESANQKADGYTKSLPHKVFLKHRKSTLNW